MPDENPEQAKRDGFYAHQGLLFADGKLVPLPAADHVATGYGFVCVERLVKALEALK